MIYKIGTRGSDLALWQAKKIQNNLKAINIQSEIVIIQTQGDKLVDLSFDKMEGKGFFTKEIELALLNKEIDLAVHSHKDLETHPNVNLKIAAVSERENPSELLIINKDAWDKDEVWELKNNSRIGTSSARRKSQILSLRPDLELINLRGNVPTRIMKLKEGHFDAIILAFAGIIRLNLDLSEFQTVVLDPEEFVPAPAQGVMAVQIRANDLKLNKILEGINDHEVLHKISLERAILRNMEGGCQLPLGVYNDGEYIHVAYSEIETEPSRYFRFRNNEDTDIIELICRQIKTFGS